jgi:hydroxypyruvate isomerase
MRSSICLEFFFREAPLVERIPRARDAGVAAGELWGLRGRDLEALRAEADRSDFAITSACAMEPIPGLNLAAGDPAIARGVVEALDAAAVLGCRQLVVMGGALLPDVPREDQKSRVVEALRALAPEARRRGVTLVLENLSSREGGPTYLLDRTADLFDVVRRVDDPAVRALLDVFHAGLMEGNLTGVVRRHHPWIGAVQIAGVPDRGEPYLGEINHPPLLRELAGLGYDGTVGLEYVPTIPSDRSIRNTLRWLEGGRQAAHHAGAPARGGRAP